MSASLYKFTFLGYPVKIKKKKRMYKHRKDLNHF